MNECGGLQCMIQTLPPHVGSSQPAQFVVDERSKLIKRLPIPSAPSQQELREAVRVLPRHGDILSHKTLGSLPNGPVFRETSPLITEPGKLSAALNDARY